MARKLTDIKTKVIKNCMNMTASRMHVKEEKIILKKCSDLICYLGNKLTLDGRSRKNMAK